jgi:hypothetical protein
MSKWTTVLAAVMLVALTACASGKSSSNASPQPNETGATPEAASTMNCNGEPPVWVLPGPRVYLVQGDLLYGKTKHGKFICRSEAHAEGYREARRPLRH